MDTDHTPIDRDDDLDWSDLDPGDVGGDNLPPTTGGEGPRRRLPPDPPRVPEATHHGMTAIICAVAGVFGLLVVVTLHASRAGGGQLVGSVLGACFAAVFLGVFYVGGLWLTRQFERARPTLSRTGAPAARR